MRRARAAKSWTSKGFSHVTERQKTTSIRQFVDDPTPGSVMVGYRPLQPMVAEARVWP